MEDEFEFDSRRNQDAEDSGNEDNEDFAVAVELDESLLNFPASGVDGIVSNSVQFQNRMGPKKAFSLMKFKKQLRKDTSLLFDERPAQAQLPRDAFDFFKVDDVTNCQNLLKHVTTMQEDAGEQEENKSFFTGLKRMFTGNEDQLNDSQMVNMPRITAMSVINPLRPSGFSQSTSVSSLDM